ncbi:MAG TPA: hypothetical protein VFE53_20380 [Mucilaginibacter sp.]|nr:hypothetical protein [Mucilaginibacter sp.]
MEYLRLSNGFGQIELGSVINQLRWDKLSYLDDADSVDTDSCRKFCYKDSDLLYLGNGLLLDRIGVRTYNDRIVNIYLFFPRNAGHAMLQNFEANYGAYTDVPGEFMYEWKTTAVTLSLRYSRAIEMGVAIFTSVDLEKQLVEDETKRKTYQQHDQDLPVITAKVGGSPE